MEAERKMDEARMWTSQCETAFRFFTDEGGAVVDMEALGPIMRSLELKPTRGELADLRNYVAFATASSYELQLQIFLALMWSWKDRRS